MRSINNTALAKRRQLEQSTKKERKSTIQYVSKSYKNYRELVDNITDVAKSAILTDSGKIQEILKLLDENVGQTYPKEQEQIEAFEQSLSNMAKNKDYFDSLEQLSLKMQKRVSEILKILEFNETNSEQNLLDAIKHYKTHNGNIKTKAPITFLTNDERNALTDEQGKFRVSLYKGFLFNHVADGIKSGKLNLLYSYKYLSINDYLIDEQTWHTSQQDLLASAGLGEFANCENTLYELKELLNDKYTTINQKYLAGDNPFLSVSDEGKIHVRTPAIEKGEPTYSSTLLDQAGFVPILRVLSEIDSMVGFTKCFKHHNIKHIKRRPESNVFLAGIIGLGCNIGTSKMAQISNGVNQNTLTNAINWYFTNQNLAKINDQIIKLIDDLSLPNTFIADLNALHGSSDGRKVNVGVESLLANYSFKYFGQNKGVSIYTFIDERQALFYSTVISASEREAAYVIDGLNNNEVSKINIHSTDTHGFTESIFAATHFMGVSFAPRIKNIGKQTIYAFSSPKTYQKKDYKILSSRTINTKLIKKHWNDILRFMVTIKLKEVTTSQLFKRLSSYAKDNPLYKAIKEFGRIIKSLFILTYYDDVELRQRIEKQLNRIELANKFSKAVFYANNSEFRHASQEEQQIATNCMIIIQNAIVLWNYLYLSQMLVNCQDQNERSELVAMVKKGSVLSWSHINLHGEFDFKNYAANESDFDLNKILALKVA